MLRSLSDLARGCQNTHLLIGCSMPGYSACPIVRGAFRRGCGLSGVTSTACCVGNNGARCRRSGTSRAIGCPTIGAGAVAKPDKRQTNPHSLTPRLSKSGFQRTALDASCHSYHLSCWPGCEQPWLGGAALRLAIPSFAFRQSGPSSKLQRMTCVDGSCIARHI